MNRIVSQANAAFRKTPIGFSALAQTQRNNKRTVIDASDVDMGRAIELSLMLSLDTEQGVMIRPLPYSEIQHDTMAALNLVMQELGLYTFPTQELVYWLRSEIDDDPDYEPHTAIEICCISEYAKENQEQQTTAVENKEEKKEE